MAQRTAAGFVSNVNAQFATNGAGLVTASTVRTHLGQDIADSFLNKTDGGTVVGNIGIGVDAPTYNLDIQTAGSSPVLRLNATTTGEPTLVLNRVGGTASSWQMYLPNGTGDLRFYNGSNRIWINSEGNMGIGQSPTAVLHLKAGTATANTAPLKLTTGTALTTPEDGALEYHSSHLYFTIGSTRYQLDQQGGTLNSGTFTTTFTSNTNLDSTPTATALTAKYTRVGDIVTVTMYANVDPTASGQYSFYASLPIASNLAAATDLLGFGSSAGADGHRCEIVADTTGDRASITGTSSGTAAATLYLMYTYKVL